jgi:MFS-type transporter involved in bile tolerance (Atg22 family)
MYVWCRCLFFLGVGLSPSTGYLFAMVALLLLAGPATPYTRTILSNTVLPTEQAQIFAAFSAVESISTLLSPLMTVLYSVSAQHDMPALAFYVMALLLVCSNLILYYVRVTPALRHNLPDEGKASVVYSSFSSAFGKEEGLMDCMSSSGYFSRSGDVSSEKERLISN